MPRSVFTVTLDDRVIVEVKSVEQLARAHPKQLLTFLKLTNRQVGLLINFGAPTLRVEAASDREWVSVLGVFAPPREPGRCG